MSMLYLFQPMPTVSLKERVMKIESKLDDLIETVKEMRTDIKCFAMKDDVRGWTLG